ncbi:MAG: hypothetical protein RMJ16_05060 [Thermoguttaceae bacterium]|nr:hypothetical protein [Thermoguttaceae bacterium]
MEVPEELWTVLVVVVALIVGVAIARRLFRRRRPGRLPPVDLSIDVAQLGEMGPPSGGPVLEYQGIPVRLAVIVLAPSGRARPLPPRTEWSQLWESILPGLSRVVAGHQPLVRTWPPQLSESGFVHRFFAEVKLPPPTGGSLPWCVAAGPVRFRDQTVLVGMVFRTAEPTTLGTEAVDGPAGWRRALFIRSHV